MAGSGKTKWPLIALALLVLGFAAGFALWKHQRERAVTRFFEQIPGTLSAEKIEVDVFNDIIVLHAVKGNVEFFADAPFALRVKKLRLEGLNRQLLDEPGVARLADKIVVEYLSFDPDERFSRLMGYSFVNVNSYEVDGLWVDWKSLLRSRDEGPKSRAFADFLLSIRHGPSIAHDASIKITSQPGFGYTQSDFLMTVTKAVLDSSSLSRKGKSRYEDYAQIYSNGARFSIKELEYLSYSAPESGLRMMLAGQYTPESFSQADSFRLLEEGYSLKGVSCKEVVILTEDGDKVEVPSLFFDMEIGNGKLLFKLQAPDVFLSGELVAGALSEIDNGLGFLNGKALRIATDFNLRTKDLPDDLIRIIYEQELHEDSLGSLAVSLTLTGKKLTAPGSALPVDIATISFESASLDVHDGGFLKDYFAYDPESPQGEGRTPEQAAKMRYEYVRLMKREMDSIPPSLREAFLAFTAFIEQSGHYAVQATAAGPLNLLNLIGKQDISQQLSLEAVHTP